VEHPEHALLHYVVAVASRHWSDRWVDSVPHMQACETILRSMQVRGDGPPVGACAAVYVTEPAPGVRFELRSCAVTLYLKDMQLLLAKYLYESQRHAQGAAAIKRALVQGAVADWRAWYGLGLQHLEQLTTQHQAAELTDEQPIPQALVDLGQRCKVYFYTAFALMECTSDVSCTGPSGYPDYRMFPLRRLLFVHYLLREKNAAHEIFNRLDAEFDQKVGVWVCVCVCVCVCVWFWCMKPCTIRTARSTCLCDSHVCLSSCHQISRRFPTLLMSSSRIEWPVSCSEQWWWL
jgi:hypothetical protein